MRPHHKCGCILSSSPGDRPSSVVRPSVRPASASLSRKPLVGFWRNLVVLFLPIRGRHTPIFERLWQHLRPLVAVLCAIFGIFRRPRSYLRNRLTDFDEILQYCIIHWGDGTHRFSKGSDNICAPWWQFCMRFSASAQLSKKPCDGFWRNVAVLFHLFSRQHTPTFERIRPHLRPLVAVFLHVFRRPRNYLRNRFTDFDEISDLCLIQ